MATKTNIDDIFERGIDIPNRRIYFGANPDYTKEEGESGSDFTWRSVELAIRAIHIMESKSAQPIEIHMDSDGGDPYRMMRLVDVILNSPCQFKFFGGGIVASSATWVMVVCDERYLLPNTSILIHDSSASEKTMHGHLTDVYIDADQEKALQDKLNTLFAENSRMPKAFWDDIVKRDMWLTADEAVSLGIADKIIEPKKRGNLRKMRVAQLAQRIDKRDISKLVKDLYRRAYKSGITKIEVTVPQEEYDPNVVVVEAPPAETKPEEKPVEGNK